MPNIDDKLTSVFLSISSGLAGMVRRIVPPSEVEDIVQETYVRVCQSNVTDEIRSPRSFMYRTAMNIALNHANKAETRLSESLEAIAMDTLRLGAIPAATRSTGFAASKNLRFFAML